MKGVLGIVAAVLALVLALEWYDWSPPQPLKVPDASDTPPETPPRAVVADLPDVDHYSVVAERPIFAEDRRPAKGDVAVKEEPPPEEPTPAPEYDLTAIVLTPTIKTALVKKAGDGTVERVLEGDVLEGWTLAQIREDRIILERQGEKNTLVLRDFPAKGSTAKAPAGGASKQPQRSPGAQRPPGMPRPPAPQRPPERPKRAER